MNSGSNILNQLEKTRDEYIELVDKVPTEDKILAAYEAESKTLEPWEISEIVESAMSTLPDELGDYVGDVFDAIYEAVADTLERVKN